MGFVDKLLGKPPGRDEFAEIVRQELAKAGVAETRYDAKDFSLRVGGGNNTIFLENTYGEYCRASKTTRPVILERLTAAFATKMEIPKNFEEARPHLMPMLRDRAYFNLADLQIRARGLREDPLKTPTQRVAGDLVAGLAYDTEHSIMQVNDESFAHWSVSVAEALKVAKDNLRERTDPNLIKEEAHGIYLGRWGDSYESARMLLTDLVYRMSVDGEPVVFIPNRNQFWVAGKRNEAAIQTLLKIGKEAHFQQHPVSPELFLLDEGKWSVYEPENAESRELLHQLRRHRLALDYTQQKKALDAIHEREGVDVFVANYSVFEKPGLGQSSVCVWTKGVDSSLPRTEKIGFMISPASKEFVLAGWDAAWPVVKHLLEEEREVVPVRYRARKFPSDEEMGKIRGMVG
jgi:hypothetical protein